jgi:hypothetical protein
VDLQINNCGDCPFLSDTFSCCELKARLEKRSMDESDKVWLDYSKDGRAVVPEWCPLKGGSLLIKLSGSSDGLNSSVCSFKNSGCGSCDGSETSQAICE